MIRSSKLFFLLILVLFSCEKKKSIAFDYGKVEKNKYTNSYFQFSIDIPENWIVQSKEQVEALEEKGKELLSGDNKTLKKALDAGDINSATLLNVSKFQLGSAVKFNPSCIIMVENLKNSPGIKLGKDYLFHVRKLLSQSQLKYSRLDEDFKKVVIDKNDFYIMNASADYLGVKVNQIYYSNVKNGFSLGIILSYNSADQKEELKKMLNTLKFTND